MRLYKLLFWILLVASATFAQSVNVQLPQSACNNNTDILLILANLPECTAEAIFSSLTQGLIFSAQQFYNLSIGFLTASPDLTWFCAPYNMIMAIIESFYSIILMGLGAYYIFHSTDVEGRTKAKIWLKNVFFMVILSPLSFGIFRLLLDLNTQLSSSMYASVSQSIFDIDAQFSNLIFSMIFAVSLSAGGILTFITLVIRYLLIPFLLFLFPIAIVLYFISPLRQWGAFIFKFIVLIVFMTTVDAIFLMGISYLFDSPDPNLGNVLVQTFGLMVGFGLIGIVNLILYLIAILSVVFMALKAFESVTAMLMRLAIILTFL
jgi:hypothetical protein